MLKFSGTYKKRLSIIKIIDFSMSDTKIVITVGPACDEEIVLKKLFVNGLSAVRINTAHAEKGYISRIKNRVEKLNKELDTFVGVMVDLKGPELRTVDTDGFLIKAGVKYELSNKTKKGESIQINFPNILEALDAGDNILMSDGKFRFQVLSKSSNGIIVKALDSGQIRDKSRVNVPGKYLDLGVLTNKDETFLKESIKANVDFFALSFVQKKENVEELQKIVMENHGNQAIISKIETKSGLKNLSDIVKVSDFIMVARGDLGVELPLEEIGLIQKKIISESHKYGVPTIVATQMLESMVNASSPTRAEVSDITNAILDNTDAVMLSEETAIGKFPEQAVLYLKKILNYVETKTLKFNEPAEFLGNRVAYSICKASKVIAEEIEADGIVAFTRSGNTARMISAVRPGVPIYSVVTDSGLARRINLLRGIKPLLVSDKQDLENSEYIANLERVYGIKKGSRLVVTSGAPYFKFGGTNDVMIITAGEFLGRGYPSGRSVKGLVSTNEKTGDILFVDSEIDAVQEHFKNFKGIIFTKPVNHEIMDEIEKLGITGVYNTKMLKKIKEKDTVFIDGYTGIITK